MVEQAMTLRQKSMPDKRRTGVWWYACAGALLGASAALLIYAPASWLALGVKAVTQGRVQLLQVQGSMWQGSGVVVLTAGAGSSSAMAWPSRWQWRLVPKGLGIQAQLQSACCTKDALLVTLNRHGVHAMPASLHMPLAVLQGLGAPWNTLQLQGHLQLQWQDMHLPWSQGQLLWQGNAQLKAMRVSTRLTTLPEIGNYQVDIQGGDQPSLTVSTLAGALQLEGQGAMKQGRWSFEGQAFAQPQQAQALANLMNLLGQRSGSKTKIKWG